MLDFETLKKADQEAGSDIMFVGWIEISEIFATTNFILLYENDASNINI